MPIWKIMMTDTASRRAVLTGAASMFALAACAPREAAAASASEKAFADAAVRKLTDAQWKARLSPLAYQVLRHEGTEQAGTGPFLNEHRKGQFVCAGCDLPLFDARWKFESGTGWPSFFDVIKSNVGFTSDFKIGYERKEYHCARCLGHQGHVFEDGPRPTGLRYCNNGVALKFVAA